MFKRLAFYFDNQLSTRELIEWSFQLKDIKFNRFDSSLIIYSIFIFYFEFWCRHNLRVHLSIGCPRYRLRPHQTLKLEDKDKVK